MKSTDYGERQREEQNKIIPIAHIQIDWQFYLDDYFSDFVPSFKTEHSEKLLDRYRMRFGMGPILWAQLDLNQSSLLRKGIPESVYRISNPNLLTRYQVALFPPFTFEFIVSIKSTDSKL